jgi:hypothetical protein
MFGLNVAPVASVFHGSDVKLFLNLPSTDPGQPPALAPQPGAIVDLRAGIKGAVTLKLAQFQQVYEALFDEVSPLLSGRVEVTIGSDVHNIDFKARAGGFRRDGFRTENHARPGFEQPRSAPAERD